MAIDFISSKPDSDETPSTMHTKSNNIEIMMGSETDEIIEELFKSLLQKYQEVLEKSTKGGEFIFDNVDVLYYNLNKINLNRGRSYIDSLEWLKNKKATISPKNNDGQYFQYVVTVALNREQIKNHPERISKIMPFIDQCNWKMIDFLSHKKNWKTFESNTEEIRHAYKSKYNLERENQVTLLMITDGEKWHYLAVKSLSTLFRGITSNNNGDFYCLNCFH